MGIRRDEVMIVNGQLKQIGASFSSCKKHVKMAVFLCECGKRIITYRSDVKAGKSTSCGCMRTVTHGHAGRRSPEYASWSSMRDRCSAKPGTNHYKNYVARGIVVCDRWKSFDLFLEDMGPRPEGHTIDRIDVNRGYSKDNCRWATKSQQNRNMKNTKRIECFGVSLSIPDWADRTGIPRWILRARIKLGWSAEQALTTPSQRRKKRTA